MDGLGSGWFPESLDLNKNRWKQERDHRVEPASWPRPSLTCEQVVIKESFSGGKQTHTEIFVTLWDSQQKDGGAALSVRRSQLHRLR